MKKYLLLVIGFTLLLAACNRNSFVKKIVGTYGLDRYLFDGTDKSTFFDTTYVDWRLTLTEDERYNKTWKDYFIYPDSLFLQDTLGYDTPNMAYIIHYDTLRFLDTIVTPYMETGKWDLLNSEEDLQLRDDSTGTASIYRILDYGKSNLTLRKGNEEFYLKK